jgi:2'-hydroxyisoflavone reductase
MDSLILKILILGGTSFLGPHLVEEIQHRGHEVTLFNRGIQNPSLFSKVIQLQGDRDGNLKALEGGRWDAIIDTSGHLPRIVEASSKLLSHATNHYTYISSIGVYENFLADQIDESYPISSLQDEKTEEITEKTYGALKALCEKVVLQYFSDRALIIRPGLIVGPYDPTDRLTYWPMRIAEGGEVLAPGDPNQKVQLIDVCDLAKWIVDMIEQKATGIYNATGPAASLTFKQLLEACLPFATSDVKLHWIDETFLLENGVQDWTEIPLWLSSKRKMPGFQSINNQKAIQTGLTFRPLSETIEETLKWSSLRKNHQWKAGLNREKEKELLRKWREQKSFKNY